MTPLAADIRRASQFEVHGFCRHCEANPAVRPRKLCGRCWRDLAIRNQYESKRPASMIAKMTLSLMKRLAMGDEMAATKEARRLASCAADELPCCTCAVIVRVNAAQRARALLLRCPWSICRECQASVSKIIAHPGEDNE